MWEKTKKHAPWIIAALAVAALLYVMGRGKRRSRPVVQAPGKTVPSRDPAMITPLADGPGSKAVQLSPARAATALQDDDSGIAATIRRGGSIAAQTIADKLSGTMN